MMKRFKNEAEVRQGVEKRLRSPVRDDVWRYVVEKRYVEEVLDGEFEDAFDNLIKEVRVLNQLAGTPRTPRRPVSRPLATPDPRWRLLVKLQAKEALRRGVAAFRARYLSEEALSKIEDMAWWRARYPSPFGLLSPEAATVWLWRQEKMQEGPPDKPPRQLEYIPAQELERAQFTRSILLRGDGPLRQLAFLCHECERRYNWPSYETIFFVLCGVLPRPAAIRCSFTQPVAIYSTEEMLPRRCTVTLDIDVDTPPEEVMRGYAEIRRYLVGNSRSRPLSAKIATLVDFVLDQPDGTTWREKMEAWNQAHPEWLYDNVDHFIVSYRRAIRSLEPPPPPKETVRDVEEQE